MAEKMGGGIPFGEGFRIVWEGVLERGLELVRKDL